MNGGFIHVLYVYERSFSIQNSLRYKACLEKVQMIFEYKLCNLKNDLWGACVLQFVIFHCLINWDY